MKCTPAHDPNDFALAKKYNFPLIKVLDETAHMNDLAGEIQRNGPLRMPEGARRRKSKRKAIS
jgi:valyl-tRNA synthetase